jgi:hypothetical protein
MTWYGGLGLYGAVNLGATLQRRWGWGYMGMIVETVLEITHHFNNVNDGTERMEGAIWCIITTKQIIVYFWSIKRRIEQEEAHFEDYTYWFKLPGGFSGKVHNHENRSTVNRLPLENGVTSWFWRAKGAEY